MLGIKQTSSSADERLLPPQSGPKSSSQIRLACNSSCSCRSLHAASRSVCLGQAAHRHSAKCWGLQGMPQAEHALVAAPAKRRLRGRTDIAVVLHYGVLSRIFPVFMLINLGHALEPRITSSNVISSRAFFILLV